MSNVKISPKGKALLKRGYSSSKIVQAIVKSGEQLASGGGLTVKFSGKTLRLKAAPVNAR